MVAFAPGQAARVTSHAVRQAIESEIERLIAILDELDGDPDLEDECEDEGAQCDDEGAIDHRFISA